MNTFTPEPPDLLPQTWTQVSHIDDRTVRLIFHRVIVEGDRLGDRAGLEWKWLCTFARLLLTADQWNFNHLKLAAIVFIIKYRLNERLMTSSHE